MNRKTRIALHLIAIGLGIIGTTLVITHTGWQVAVGVFLLLWANNIGNKQ